MNLRFRVLSQPYNVLPSDYDPSAAGVVVDKANIGLTIYVNDALFFTAVYGDLTDVSTYSGTIGGVASDFSVENTDYLKLNLDTPVPRTKVKVRIDITAPEGWRNYSNEFYVFGYDLGNNPNIAYPAYPPFPGNPNFDITLAPFTFIPGGGNPPSTNIFPSPLFTAYRNPADQSIQVVKLTSALGDYFLFTGNSLLATGSAPVVTDDANELVQLSYYGTKANFAQSIKFLSDLNALVLTDPNDVVGNDTPVPAGLYDFPSLTHQIITPGICNGDCDCIQDISQVRILFDGLDLYPFVTDDDYIFGSYAIFFLNLELRDGTNDTVVDTDTQQINFDIYTPGYTLFFDYAIPDAIPFDRYYILKVQITDGVTVLKTAEYVLQPCGLAELTREHCGDFTFTNKSTDATIVIKSMAQDGTLTEIVSYDVLLGGTKAFTLDDGIYTIDVVRNDVTEYSYKIFVHCTISSCMDKFLDAIACADPCDEVVDDCGCGGNKTSVKIPAAQVNLYNFSAFMLTAMTYLQLVNAIYATNWIFTVLPDDELEQLREMTVLHDRLTKYCIGCD